MKKQIVYLFVFLLVFTIAFPILAAPISRKEPFSISGKLHSNMLKIKVIDEDNGSPLSGVKVVSFIKCKYKDLTKYHYAYPTCKFTDGAGCVIISIPPDIYKAWGDKAIYDNISLLLSLAKYDYQLYEPHPGLTPGKYDTTVLYVHPQDIILNVINNNPFAVLKMFASPGYGKSEGIKCKVTDTGYNPISQADVNFTFYWSDGNVTKKKEIMQGRTDPKGEVVLRYPSGLKPFIPSPNFSGDDDNTSNIMLNEIYRYHIFSDDVCINAQAAGFTKYSFYSIKAQTKEQTFLLFPPICTDERGYIVRME